MDVLNLEIIKGLPYPLYSIKVQAQIVKEIEYRLLVCDAVEQQIQDSLSQAEALRRSILKKAFERHVAERSRSISQPLFC